MTAYGKSSLPLNHPSMYSYYISAMLELSIAREVK